MSDPEESFMVEDEAVGVTSKGAVRPCSRRVLRVLSMLTLSRVVGKVEIDGLVVLLVARAVFIEGSSRAIDSLGDPALVAHCRGAYREAVGDDRLRSLRRRSALLV